MAHIFNRIILSMNSAMETDSFSPSTHYFFPFIISTPTSFVLSAMARLWSPKRLSGSSHSSPFTFSGRRGRSRLSSMKIDDNDDGTGHVEASLELEEILEENENAVEILPRNINMSSAEDGNTDSCVVLNGDAEVCTMRDVDRRETKSRLTEEESVLAVKFYRLMEALEGGLPHCMDVVKCNATEGIFPVDKDKYQGLQSIGSLHSM